MLQSSKFDLRSQWVFALLATTLMFTGDVTAADGALEINQDCVSSGCFPGDTPGFPVQISSSGSYLLTSNLDISGESTPQNVTVISISVTSNGVTIDLNGFGIIGTTTCDGNPTECTPLGTGVGINGNQSERVTIRNGRISGMGGSCIMIDAEGARVDDMDIQYCGDDGVDIDVEGAVTNSYIRRNGGDGVNGATLITGNIITFNGGRGVATSGEAGFAFNIFSGNDGGPFNAGEQMSGNICTNNLCVTP